MKSLAKLLSLRMSGTISTPTVASSLGASVFSLLMLLPLSQETSCRRLSELN